jgi:PHD/YefM family antitoxin component YafN of YafNO toxin-antitoxin module
MQTVDIFQLKNETQSMIDRALSGEKILIVSENGNSVLLSEEEWNGTVETVYLLSDPETLPALKEARKTALSEFVVWDPE